MTKFKPTSAIVIGNTRTNARARRRRSNRRTTRRRNVRSNITLSRINCLIAAQRTMIDETLIFNEEVDTFTARLRANTLKLLDMLENPDTIYVFGDSRHGGKFFEFLNTIWDCLSSRQQDLLENSHYFTEKSNLFGHFTERVDPENLFPVDDRLGLNPPVGASPAILESFGMKRISVTNNHWPQFIRENLTSIGLNIIALGRTHLYEYMSVPEEEPWPTDVRIPCSSFQDALAAALPEKTIKTYAFVDIFDPTITYDVTDVGIIKPVKPVPLITL